MSLQDFRLRSSGAFFLAIRVSRTLRTRRQSAIFESAIEHGSDGAGKDGLKRFLHFPEEGGPQVALETDRSTDPRRSAAMSPARARLIAFCVSAEACPSSNASNARVVALRVPFGLPAGLPD